MPSRTLIVDRRGGSGRDRARSRGEALEQLTANEYDTIELYTAIPGRDEYGLVTYLAATWPAFLRQVTLRTVTPGRASTEWNDDASRFVFTAPPARSRRRGDELEGSGAGAEARQAVAP